VDPRGEVREELKFGGSRRSVGVVHCAFRLFCVVLGVLADRRLCLCTVCKGLDRYLRLDHQFTQDGNADFGSRGIFGVVRL
jgi:hypothetical protein